MSAVNAVVVGQAGGTIDLQRETALLRIVSLPGAVYLKGGGLKLTQGCMHKRGGWVTEAVLMCETLLEEGKGDGECVYRFVCGRRGVGGVVVL